MWDIARLCSKQKENCRYFLKAPPPPLPSAFHWGWGHWASSESQSTRVMHFITSVMCTFPLFILHFLSEEVTWQKLPAALKTLAGPFRKAKSKAEVNLRSPSLTNMKMSPGELQASLFNKDCQWGRLIRNKMRTVSHYGQFEPNPGLLLHTHEKKQKNRIKICKTDRCKKTIRN